MLHATPNITNGIDIIPIIPKIVKNDDSETRGLLIIQGNGNEMTNQITASKIYICVFLLSFMITARTSCINLSHFTIVISTS